VSLVPWFSAGWIFPIMCAFQACQLGNYAVSDAAMLERVSPDVRGRVVGVFLTIAGTFGALSPWAMGWWVDLLKDRATQPAAYIPIFATLGAMLACASFAAPFWRGWTGTGAEDRANQRGDAADDGELG